MNNPPKLQVASYVADGTLLGQGQYGKVYGGKCTRTNRQVAIKVISTPEIGSLENEIQVLKKLTDSNHPNILNLLHAEGFQIHGSKHFFIITERCDGDLGTYLESRGRRLPEPEIRLIAHQLGSFSLPLFSFPLSLSPPSPSLSIPSPLLLHTLSLHCIYLFYLLFPFSLPLLFFLSLPTFPAISCNFHIPCRFFLSLHPSFLNCMYLPVLESVVSLLFLSVVSGFLQTGFSSLKLSFVRIIQGK